MKEKDLRRMILRCTGGFGHAERVECPENSGMPDLNVFWRGRENWIELKIYPKGLRMSQIKWFRRRLDAGGNPFVCFYDMDKIWLLKGHRAIQDENTKRWKELAVAMWAIGNVNWDAFVRIVMVEIDDNTKTVVEEAANAIENSLDSRGWDLPLSIARDSLRSHFDVE